MGACQALTGHTWLLPAWLHTTSAAQPSSGPSLDAQHLPRAAACSRPSMPAQHAAAEAQRPCPTRHTGLPCALQTAQSQVAQVQKLCYSGFSTAVSVHLHQLTPSHKITMQGRQGYMCLGRNKALAAPSGAVNSACDGSHGLHTQWQGGSSLRGRRSMCSSVSAGSRRPCISRTA